jgi:hypothetical protein
MSFKFTKASLQSLQKLSGTHHAFWYRGLSASCVKLTTHLNEVVINNSAHFHPALRVRCVEFLIHVSCAPSCPISGGSKRFQVVVCE